MFFGMIASGKSTLAENFANSHNLSYYNTDRVRKELAGLEPTSRIPEGLDSGIYSKEFTRKTYQAMIEGARKDFRAGQAGVVLDGSYHRRADRDAVREMAEEMGVNCLFVQCICGDDEVKKRLVKRASDPQAVSDGRWEIYQAQKKSFEPPVELPSGQLVVIDTENEIVVLLSRLDNVLLMDNM